MTESLLRGEVIWRGGQVRPILENSSSIWIEGSLQGKELWDKVGIQLGQQAGI